ncbi:MAG: tetratricopeptide repeat protein [Nannocystales bacterium]
MTGSDHRGLRKLGAEVRRAQQQDAGVDRLRQRAAVVAAAAAAPQGHTAAWAPSFKWAGIGALAVAAAAVLWLRGEQAPPAQAKPTPIASSKRRAPAGPTIVSPSSNPDRSDPANAPVSSSPLQLASGTVELAPSAAREVVAGVHRIDVDADARVTFTWEPTADALDVRVEEGSVSVHVATATHIVVAGYQARVHGSEVVITSTRTISKGADETSDEGPSKAPRGVDGRRDQAWKRLAKDGRYVDALAQATGANALKKTGSLSKAELKLLADVARLGGAPQDSIAVLQTLRRRFPKSREARRAAFYLGRQAEREARLEDAATWYRTYLESNAQGSLRAEARGRLLGVLRRRGEHAAARSVAREVLQDDPQGTYVDLARKTLGDAP